MINHQGQAALPVRVLSAPDWRSGNPYQSLLAESMSDFGVDVVFPAQRRALLPLVSQLRSTRSNVLHVHWPEAYLGQLPPSVSRWCRFLGDIWLCSRRVPIVYTAHNLLPHNVELDGRVKRAYADVLRLASRVIVHSQESAALIEETFRLANLPFTCIPHGDLSGQFGSRYEQKLARQVLGLDDHPFVLMFGVVEPYKGIEVVIDAWRNISGAKLIVAGRPYQAAYGEVIERLARNVPGVSCAFGWLSDLEIRLWLSAANAVLFNYRKILTSGAASLARSFGCPVLLPNRLKTVFLDEPHPLVMRFQDDFRDLPAKLGECLSMNPSFDDAKDWRELTSWKVVGKATSEVFHRVLNSDSFGAERAS